MKQLSNAQFIDWDKTPVFYGQFVENSIRFEDQDPKQGNGKKGDVNGFVFTTADGNSSVVGNSKAIVDALAKCNDGKGISEGQVVGFRFQKMVKLKGGKNFRVFEVIEFEDIEEATKFYGE